MIWVKSIQEYFKKSEIDLAFVIVILGLFLTPFVHYAWLISIAASLFIREDEE